MRRPPKPFVTEYRGGSRRQAPGAKIDPLKSEGVQEAKPEPSPAELWTPRQTMSDAAQEDGYDAALRAADALFAVSSKVGRVAATTPQPLASEAPMHPGGGRVLRVLDEAPSPEMLRLEAERAPKKRGRKPGSKNRPKDVSPSAAAASEPPHVPSAPEFEVREAPSLPAATTLVAITRSPSATLGLPRGGRYAWVRTRLKPGQQWKRRLPKVAW